MYSLTAVFCYYFINALGFKHRNSENEFEIPFLFTPVNEQPLPQVRPVRPPPADLDEVFRMIDEIISDQEEMSETFSPDITSDEPAAIYTTNDIESQVDELDEDRVYMGNEVSILLDIEQSLIDLSSANYPERDRLISQWCMATEQTFEQWNLEFQTVLVLFDVSGFQNGEEERSKIVRARDVGNLSGTTPMNVLREVIAAHSQAEVLLQLRYEYDQFDDGDNFDTEVFDSFCIKCDNITSLWGWSKSLSYSLLSKMFNNL